MDLKKILDEEEYEKLEKLYSDPLEYFEVNDYYDLRLLLKNLKFLINFFNLEMDVYSLWNADGLYLDDMELEFIPKEIGELTNLKILSLEYNNLKYLPEELGRLNNLEYLHVDGNELITLPKSLAYLPKLKYIDVENNSDITIPQEILNNRNIMIDY